MYYFKDYNAGDGDDTYQRSLHERANESLNELRECLSTSFPSPPSTRTKEDLTRQVHPRLLSWQEGLQRPQKYKDAAANLRNLLSLHEDAPSEEPTARSGPTLHPPGPLPSPADTAVLLQHQASYTQQLEAENRYIKEELALLRLRLTEMMAENQQLHSELKTTVVHEILREGGDITQVLSSLGDNLAGTLATASNRQDFKKWQIELERLSSLHAAKTERLEIQLSHARTEVERQEQIVEDLKSQLRMQDSIPTHENGLPGDIFLSSTQRSAHRDALERTTRERDDLMDQVSSLKGRLQEMSRREEEAYQQMKKGIQLVEQAQLEQTQALIQKEQTGEELQSLRQRFEAYVLESQGKLEAEKEAVRTEFRALLEELNKKVHSVMEEAAAAKGQLERVTREKVALSSELDYVKQQLRQCDVEVTMTTENFRSQTTNASLQRSTAQQEVKRLRSELDNLRLEKDQERGRLQTEVESLRRRLGAAERELVNSKEESIHLASNCQALERELHLAKLARDSMEKRREEDLQALTKRTQRREEELSNFIHAQEEAQTQKLDEMDSMLLKQNRLLLKLRGECRRQAADLEKLTKRNRGQCGKLKRENEELRLRGERRVARLTELEEQADQHSRLHDKMKQRLKQMDDHAQHQAKQLVELLSRLSRVARDRQLLAQEVEFLRSQLAQLAAASSAPTDAVPRLHSPHKALVDDILNGLTKEEREGKGLLKLSAEMFDLEKLNADLLQPDVLDSDVRKAASQPAGRDDGDSGKQEQREEEGEDDEDYEDVYEDEEEEKDEEE